VRYRVALLTSLLLLLGAGTAQASIKIYESSEAATLLGEVKKGKCKVKRTNAGRVFHAAARTTNGVYTLNVDIYSFKGFGPDYNVPFGVIDPTVDVESATQDFSNNFAFPGGQPPPGAGAIAFAKRGAILGLGIYALPNSDYSQGVVLAEHMKCIYPK
jgi:hypothetical protein